MGQNYKLFLAKIPCEDLAQKLKTEKFIIDETPSYIKEFDEETESLKAIDLVQDKKITFEQFMEKFKLSDETQAYRDRNDGKAQITIFPFPKHPEWTIGWFFNVLGFGKKSEEIYITLSFIYNQVLLKFVPEIWFVEYGHGSNDGNVWKHFWENDVIKLTQFDYIDGENENFEKYIKRMQKETKVPFSELHNWMLTKKKRVKWNCHFRIDINLWGEDENVLLIKEKAKAKSEESK
jgi:hypothetical protein